MERLREAFDTPTWQEKGKKGEGKKQVAQMGSSSRHFKVKCLDPLMPSHSSRFVMASQALPPVLSEIGWDRRLE